MYWQNVFKVRVLLIFIGIFLITPTIILGINNPLGFILGSISLWTILVGLFGKWKLRKINSSSSPITTGDNK